MDVQKAKKYIQSQYDIAYPDPNYRPYQVLDVKETSNIEHPLQVLVGGYTDEPIEPSWYSLTRAETCKISHNMEQ